MIADPIRPSRTCCATSRRRSSARSPAESGDFDAAEDAVQEALIAAADHWPREGIPENPRAWLAADGRPAAHRPAPERAGAREPRAAGRARLARAAPAHAASDEDDTLAVLFMCCHPSLTPASAIALTLRAVGGLTTPQIARAFLVPEATMAQRISRAKRTIKESGVPFRIPTPDERPVAIRSVLHVLYLMFNEGYVSERRRRPRATAAWRTRRSGWPGWSDRQLPDDPEVAGLLALMLLIEARRPARTTADGEPVPLPEQDRSRWDRGADRGGDGDPRRARSRAGRVGEYQLQAAIAAIHDRAPTADATDWPQILALYELLERMTGNPVVTVNRAVAAAMANGPAAGLDDPRRPRRLAGGHPPRRRRPSASARDGRRHRRGGRAVPGGRAADDEPRRAAPPLDAGRPPPRSALSRQPEPVQDQPEPDLEALVDAALRQRREHAGQDRIRWRRARSPVSRWAG